MRQGWILDVYPVAQGMCVWMVDTSGRATPYLDPWQPGFYLQSRPGSEAALHKFFQSFKIPINMQVAEKIEFFSGKTQSVLSVRVGNPLFFSTVAGRLLKDPHFTLFNADINLGQCYFYERGLFPLAKCAFDADVEGRIQKWGLEESEWKVRYALPPLRYAHLGIESIGGQTRPSVKVDPSHRPSAGSAPAGRRGCYVLTLGQELGKGRTYVLDASEEDLILSLNRHIEEWDPDVILTDWGDSYILPRLQMHSQRTAIPLKLSRDPRKHVRAEASHSFFSYGKMIYRAGTRTLYGRLHIDTRNSFSLSHTGLDGLYEISRVAKIPIQRAARCTIGTSLSSMQYEWAVRNHRLIPVDKGQTEDFRPADSLISADRGGLVYEPEVGWHEDLVEYDFSSMYPEIMIRHNVTPEGVNCACCPDNGVPEIGHHLCRHRGMVPAVLGPLVRKRRRYKQLIRAGHPDKAAFQARYDAFKWALVTSFGYLGFRNARFGKIEAHECVNAYSREALLRSKEIAEAEGFHFVHAIVDSLWLQKPGVTDQEIDRLRRRMERATGLPIGLEGRYRWIRFCPSKTNPRIGVPNRYFGAFTTGDLKVRGIALRRHDTPLFIKNLQEEMLRAMSHARTLAELRRTRPELEAIVDGYRDRLKCGQVTPLELAVSVCLTRSPGDYVNDTLSAIAAKKLAASGIKLHVGEAIQFVVAEAHADVKDWRVTPLAFIEDWFEYDRRYYGEMLEEAIDIAPFFPVSSSRHKQQPRPSSRQLEFAGFL